MAIGRGAERLQQMSAVYGSDRSAMVDPHSEDFYERVEFVMSVLNCYESNSLKQLKATSRSRNRLREKLEERRKTQRQIAPQKEEPITEKKLTNKKKKKKKKKGKRGKKKK